MERVVGRATWHSLSFGDNYDPERLRIGPIVCHDEHLLARDQGFGTHRHEELEIVTWPLSGALTHQDDLGTHATLTPGTVGHLTAGTGVSHSELAAATQTRFVQVWLTPDRPGLPPTYSSNEVALGPGRLCEVLRPTSTATFSVARLDAGESVSVPGAALRHVYVASGGLLRSSLAEPLGHGDAFVSSGDGAEDPIDVTAAMPTELLVWQFA